MWKIFFEALFGGLKSIGDNTTTRLGIAAKYSTGLIAKAMDHKMYWVAWGIAAVPMAAWFGWGMLDTLTNGALPDVAQIPPGLKPYAETVWNNIFWTGVTGYGISTAAKVVTTIFDRIFGAK